MKKTILCVLALVLILSMLVACEPNSKEDGSTTAATTTEGTTDTTPVEKNYTLIVVGDTSANTSNKVSNYVLALVIDDANKIVAARFDCSEVTPALDDAGAIIPVESVDTKVERGDGYTGMPAGSWAKQTAAFEAAIVGKTADEVANLDMTLVAGCTMANTPATFKALVAEAFASTLKVTFTTAEEIKLGAAIDTVVKSGKGGKVTVGADLVGTVVVGDKVVATMIDSSEFNFTIEEGALVAAEFQGTKNERGEGYTGMPAGAWYKQAQVFANTTVGKTAAELENLETVSDALAAAGCTMQNTTAGYKATIITAVSYAK